MRYGTDGREIGIAPFNRHIVFLDRHPRGGWSARPDGVSSERIDISDFSSPVSRQL